jgi:uncharacterized protein (TIGR03083 family)
VTPERYLELIEQDGRRLAVAAASGALDAPIPTCPGWDVGECVAHTAAVYRNRIAGIVLQRRPDPTEVEAKPDDVDLVPWFESSHAALLSVLRDRGPEAPAYTWWPADQTVGFWFRRMAQETAVHRLDVEDGRGTPTPIDPDLAVDGIDEVLDLFLGDDWTSAGPEDWGDVDPRAGAGGTVAVRSGGRVWRSTLGPDAVPLVRDDGPADATVAGEAQAVLLWLWGRRDEGVEVDGDPDLLVAYRDRLRIATQ